MRVLNSRITAAVSLVLDAVGVASGSGTRARQASERHAAGVSLARHVIAAAGKRSASSKHRHGAKAAAHAGASRFTAPSLADGSATISSATPPPGCRDAQIVGRRPRARSRIALRAIGANAEPELLLARRHSHCWGSSAARWRHDDVLAGQRRLEIGQLRPATPAQRKSRWCSRGRPEPAPASARARARACGDGSVSGADARSSTAASGRLGTFAIARHHD